MTIKQINQLIEEGRSLKTVSEAYSEIASIKLKRIRDEVERNRAFFKEMSEIYRQVKAVAVQRGLRAVYKPKKTISILITSNYRFYGNINNDLVLYFLVQTSKYATDKLVIGKTGLEYLKSMNYFHNFQPLILKTDNPDAAELAGLSEIIKDYAQVVVFYSQLKSVLIQTPTFKDITEIETKMTAADHPNKGTDYIFEPELAKILDFFESQVKILLLEQEFLESELSRNASRLISMDQSRTRADKFMTDQIGLLGVSKRDMVNRELLETVTHLMSAKKGGLYGSN